MTLKANKATPNPINYALNDIAITKRTYFHEKFRIVALIIIGMELGTFEPIN